MLVELKGTPVFDYLVKIWQEHPLLSAFGIFVITYGITMTLSSIGRKADLSKYWSLNFGDPIFLSIFAGCAAAALSNYERQGRWFESNWTFVIVFLLATVYILSVEGYYPGGTPTRSFWNLSQAYHTTMVPFMATAVIVTAFALVWSLWDGTIEVTWLSIFATLGLVGYAATALRDALYA